MLCDDLLLTEISPMRIKNACSKSIDFFEKALQANATKPSLAGNPTDLNTAIKTAADILRASHQPLFAGLGTEVQGMRAIMRLAEKTNATLDHMHSEATMRNTLALQNSGWQTTTLTEVKNRADVILAIGTDIVSSHPRFFEKLVWNSDSLFDKAQAEIIYLGVAEESVQAGISPDGKKPLVIPAETQKLPEIINALNVLSQKKNSLSKKLVSDLIGGVSIASLRLILEKLKTAQYAVVVWSASHLNYAHAELTVQSITQLISTLNESNRVAGLPLNAGDGDSSVNNTSTWLTGYPTRSRLLNGQPQYDSYHFSSRHQLKSCDALLWLSTFNPHQPPSCDAPIIAIGHANMQFDRQPDVFIPVGVPGVHHAGTMFRMDSAVAMPLKKLWATDLLSLSEVIHRIEALLT